MMVTFDTPRQHKVAALSNRTMLCAHLMSEDLDELHKFAEQLGLKRSYFQNQGWPHYDLLGAGMIEKARVAGAKQVTGGEQLERTWHLKYPGCTFPSTVVVSSADVNPSKGE